jgi:hypothetical protein
MKDQYLHHVLGFGILFINISVLEPKSIITGSGSVSCNLIIADNAFEQVWFHRKKWWIFTNITISTILCNEFTKIGE